MRVIQVRKAGMALLPSMTVVHRHLDNPRHLAVVNEENTWTSLDTWENSRKVYLQELVN